MHKSKYYQNFLIILLLVSTLLAFSEKPLTNFSRSNSNPDNWDLSIGGSIYYDNENNYPCLKKNKNDQEKWNSILRLAQPLNISAYLGKNIYFITEAKANGTYRLAPNFFVNKDGQKFLIWWTETDLNRKYLSFESNSQASIRGHFYLPKINDSRYKFVAQIEGEKPFVVSDSGPLTLSDLASGLSTDWQHDLPGKYSYGDKTFPGLSGQVIFKHFYIGTNNLEPVIFLDKWANSLSTREKKILSNEFGVKFVTDSLKDYQYPLGDETEIYNYLQKNKSAFNSDPYFQKENFVACGDTAKSWQVVACQPEEEIRVQDHQLVIKNKLNPYSWTIIKIAEITDSEKLADLRGVVRLTTRLQAEGLIKGELAWQNVLLEAILLDDAGNQINENQNLCTLPLNQGTDSPQNIAGDFVDEFIIGPKVKKIELVLKIAGAPDDDKQKKGIRLTRLAIDKVALQKTEQKLELEQLLSEITNKKLVVNNGKYKKYLLTEKGLVVGDRDILVNEQQVIFNIENSQQYTGLYSNLFSLQDIDELEIAADFSTDTKIIGNLPDWASLTLQIDYFNENGEAVYTADYGLERYPKISVAPNQKFATKKSFFHAPKERGASYAQIKIHVLRKPNQAKNGFDQDNYLIGKLAIKNIIARPALKFDNQGWLPNNGNFYKHINGSSLTWDFNGPVIKEDLAKQSRQIIFNNNSKQWSSLKTVVDIPAKAQLAKGKIKLNIKNIATGIEQWQGFGFFLEADVLDNLNNTYHFAGIPVFQMINNQLVRLERIPHKYNGEIDFYIPLYHEQLKISKLYFQIALAGSGLAVIEPLSTEVNAPLIELEMIADEKQPDIAAFWSQYSLYGAQANNIYFQKNYRAEYQNQIAHYEFDQSLIAHLDKPSINMEENLKKLRINQTVQIDQAKITALPSYARVAKEFTLPKDCQLLVVSFNLQAAIPADSKFNFKVEMLDKNKNTFSPNVYYLSKNQNWKMIDNQDVFEFEERNLFALPINQKFSTARIIFGNNQGELSYSNIQIVAVKNASLDNLPLSFENTIPLYQQKQLNDYQFNKIEKNNILQTDNELQPIQELLIGTISVNNQKQQDIKNSIRNGQVFFQKGTWYYAPQKDFTPVGFTVVGETFHKWFEQRRLEFTKPTDAYWLKYLQDGEKNTVLNADNSEQFILGFARAQANIWQTMGINYLRIHQIFASWSGLNNEEIALVVKILKIWQKEKGFLIDFDLLPNPDLRSDFFALKDKPLTTDLSSTIDLFKASLVLPEIRQEYVEPAISKILELFKKNNFFPNALSYCNETGFTHGYWLIDRNNSASHNVVSTAYQKYYSGYLSTLQEMPTMQSSIHKLYSLFQLHIESRQIIALLSDLENITKQLNKGKRIKDLASYIYYNLLRDDTINSFSTYAEQLASIRKNGYRQLATAFDDENYYKNYTVQINKALQAIGNLKKQILVNEQKNAKELEELLTSPGFKQDLQRLTAKTLLYPELKSQDFQYIDSFKLDSEQKIFQSFFTSFLLQTHFENAINQLIAQYQDQAVIGLNNDYIKDPFAILQRSFAFCNGNNFVLRFNKYAHHPVGGHSMLLNPGAGNVFDNDSKIYDNLILFNPLHSLGYKLCLSETNHTYAGGSNAGESNWSLLDQLQVMSAGHTLLGFRYGLNNFDKPLISDYFNLANRPNKVNQFNLLAYLALRELKIDNDDFIYNSYSKTVELNNPAIQAIAGIIKKGSTVNNQANTLKFEYNGNKDQTALTIIKTQFNKDDFLVSLFGIERNSNQINRVDNINLIESYGQSPILYEYFTGTLEIAVNPHHRYRVIGYYADSRKPIELSKGNYQQTGNKLKIFLLSKNKGIQTLKIEKI